MVMFALMRFLFILFNRKIASSIPFNELAMSFVHGLRLDLSTAAYLSVFPFLLWLIAQYVKVKWVDYVFTFYNITVLLAVALLTIIDAELYAFWGQKLNAYASSFAKFPKEMFSFSSGISYSKIIFFGLLTTFLVKITYTHLPLKLKELGLPVKASLAPIIFIVVGAITFLMIRGNVGMSPINQSFAYYSDKPFLNHCAVNTTWNFIASLADNTEDEKKNPYAFLPNKEAVQIVNELVASSTSTQNSFKVSTQNNPDILLVILEGWSADVVGFTGGEAGVSPKLNALANEGLSFVNFYANGNRTDKGLASIISAQPALAKSSIINKLQKFSNLPALPKALQALGYKSKFIYGGESEFANMKAYWINSGYNSIVDIHEFNKTILPENWGVHDDELYKKVLEEFPKTPSPKFITALTLSSHEPYNVPHKSKYTGTSQAELYKNSVHFSDKCLGDFIAQAKQQPWYKNTLIIILPDHAHQEPLNRQPYEPARFHIPLLITGGALNPEVKGLQVNKVGQQTDLAPSILAMLGVKKHSFTWGVNLFDTAQAGMASYTFDDGIGLVKSNGYVSFDQQSKRLIMSAGADSLNMIKQARAYQQVYYNEYLTR
jgi:phosphoglycerol transferase MdoB-like AlkP superfamily enzyme